MYDYRSELQRRIAQFASFLTPMRHRAHSVVKDSCFMIFEERRPEGVRDDALVEKRQLALQAVRGEFSGPNENGPFADESFELPDDGWRGDDSLRRFVQFSFEDRYFLIDMPLQTLSREEAGEILRQRSGFFRMADNKQFAIGEDTVRKYDPFNKMYIYGDETSAAEDMAFIFFQVWKFPVDSRWYVSSAAFKGKHRWEQGVPIE